MKIQNTRKLGFFTALTICIGSVIGIGIFFKNASIGSANNGDGVSWLLSWIIGGVIALLVAIHFGRISKIKISDHHVGLSGWAQVCTKKSKNKWFANLVTVNYSFFYNSILFIILSFFCSEMLVNFFYRINGGNINDFPIWGVSLIAILLIGIFSISNILSSKYTGFISQSTTILKMAPLLIVIIVGIVLPNNHETPSGGNGFLENNNTFFQSFQGIMISLPAVLFAFDSFIGVGAMSDRIKNGEKVVSKIIVFGIISVLIIYIFVAISSILHSGDFSSVIENTITDIFPKEVADGMNIFLSLTLFISIFGTANGVNAICLNEFKNLVKGEILFGTRKLNKKIGETKTTYLISGITFLIWSMIVFIPASILNNDQIVDGFSNFPTILFFIIYTMTIYFYWKNIYLTTERQNEKFPRSYSVLVWISIISVLTAVIINFVMVGLSGIATPFENSSWGIYMDGGIKVNNLTALIMYIVFIIMFIVVPIINKWLVKKYEKRILFLKTIDFID
ncbi:MAG: APC family permease [Metamycoplasmataceae bacterium]